MQSFWNTAIGSISLSQERLRRFGFTLVLKLCTDSLKGASLAREFFQNPFYNSSRMFDIVDRTHVLISVGVVAAPVKYPGPFFARFLINATGLLSLQIFYISALAKNGV